MKRGWSLSFLVGTISNVLVMEIGWTDVGSGGDILVSCAHSNTSYIKFQPSMTYCLQKKRFSSMLHPGIYILNISVAWNILLAINS